MRDLYVNTWTHWIFIPVIVFSWATLTPLDFSITQSAYAQDVPITPSGLHTQVSDPIAVGGQTQYDIIGGIRPGGGANLFHSFGQFNVPSGNIANFLNTGSIDLNGTPLPPNLPTDNIFGRVTEQQNPSIIFGMIQTNGAGGFDHANLFLMNPYGFLFGPNATINVGGMITFTTADYLNLADGNLFKAMPDPASDPLLSAASVAAFGFLGSNPSAIRVEGSTLKLATGTGLSFVGGDISIGADPETGTPAFISAPSGRINLVSVASPGEVLYPSLERGPNINNQTFTAMGAIAVSDFATLDVSGNSLEGDGHAGSIRIRGGQLIVENFSFLTASTVGDKAGDTPSISVIVHEDATAGMTGNVTLHNVSGIITGTGSGAGRDGGIEIVAKNVEIADGSFIQTGSNGPGEAGNITIHADTISLTGRLPDEGLITNITTLGGGSVEGGTISLSGRGLSGQTLSIFDQGQILTSSSSGRGGDIRIEMDHVTVSDGATLVASSGSFASAGDILITAPESFSLTGLSPGGAGSAITSISNLSPANISITTGEFLLGEGARIDGQTSALQGGHIGISATEPITIQDNSFIASISNVGTGTSLELYAPTILIDQSTLSARSAGTADGGMITAHATNGNLILDHGSVIASSTGGSGTGGIAEVTASDSVLIAGGSSIESNSFSTSSGGAGSVTVRAENLVALSGTGSRLLTEARGSGDGGNILVAANQVQITDGAVISAASTGAGAGGLITIDAGSTFASNASTVSSTATQAQGGDIAITVGQSATLNNGSRISTSSTGPGNAGNIHINAGNLLTMTNSSVTTEADQAGGGEIEITTNPGGTFQLINSLISASVLDGMGGGGSVSIDPQYVILQNSQILAQAVQGPGGKIKISITNGGLFLPDANSLISASSQFGVNGTVTIQSPNAPVSGQIQPLGKTPLIATSLLNQHCAALAGGQFSSFTVAGRDSLPTEPGSWLTSPLYAAGMEPRLKAEVGKAEGMSMSAGQGAREESWSSVSSSSGVFRASHQRNETNQIHQMDQIVLSLRQIAPAGFLTRAFAVDEPAGCQS